MSLNSSAAGDERRSFGFHTDTRIRQIYMYDNPSLKSIEKKISVGKSLTFAGIGITGSFVPLFVGGTVLVAASFVNENPSMFFAGFGLYYWSFIDLAVGVPMVIVGAVFWGVGKKQKKQLASKEWELRGVLKPNGQVGLVLKF